MVDKAVLAAKVASVRDAVERIRAVLPESAAAFETDRTAREVVVLNLFVALQEYLASPPTGSPTRSRRLRLFRKGKDRPVTQWASGIQRRFFIGVSSS
jgi:hypothetical protein